MKKEPHQNFKIQKWLSALIIAIGVILVIFMIVTEDEPGAIPLLLVVSGIGWKTYIRYKMRSLQS